MGTAALTYRDNGRRGIGDFRALDGAPLNLPGGSSFIVPITVDTILDIIGDP